MPKDAPARFPERPDFAILGQHLGKTLTEIASDLSARRVKIGSLIVTLVVLGGLIVFSQGSAIAPFIYTLF